MRWRGAAVWAWLGVTGCAVPLGTIEVAGRDLDAVGTMMLHPDLTGKSCRASLFGLGAEGSPEIGEALADILAVDREGNLVAHVKIERRELWTGVYNRRCIVVHGDLVRVIPTVTIPVPGHHH